MEDKMDQITTEMMEYICDNLCAYLDYTSGEKMEEICAECKMGNYLTAIFAEQEKYSGIVLCQECEYHKSDTDCQGTDFSWCGNTDKKSCRLGRKPERNGWLQQRKEKKMRDKIAESLAQIDMRYLLMPIISVYGKNQIEYPGEYVARVFDAEKPTNTVIIRDSLEELQSNIELHLPWMFMGIFMERTENDDPSLIGCWI